MAASLRTQTSAIVSADEEVDFLILSLLSLENMTTLGGPRSMVQMSADELCGMFRLLRLQAERIEHALKTG